MYNKLKHLAAAVAALALAGGAVTAVHAQDYPTRPITLVVPYPAGTPVDNISRTLGEQLAVVLKQPVVVENRPGAYQVVASNYVARQKPDGYMLMMTVAPNVAPPSLQKNPTYVGNTDFDAVGYIAVLDTILGVSPNLPVSNLNEFIALLKANPDKYVFASSGVGTPHHMNIEMFNRQAGAKAIHVPYSASQNIILDTSTGQVNYSLFPLSAMQFAAAGKLKVFGITSAKRDPGFPEIKTLQEQGINGMNGAIKYFIVTTKGTPPAIINKINTAINSVIVTEAYSKKFAAIGGISIPAPLPAAEVARQLSVEDKRFQALAADGTIKLD